MRSKVVEFVFLVIFSISVLNILAVVFCLITKSDPNATQVTWFEVFVLAYSVYVAIRGRRSGESGK